MDWYEVKNVDTIDSPALLVYPDRIQHNIQMMIRTANNNSMRLVPHVKTHKMQEIVRMQMDACILNFKCATIAELEMCLEAGVNSVLLAYPLVGPKVDRVIALRKKYPNSLVDCLVDSFVSAVILAKKFGEHGLDTSFWFDINNGQNRTGHPLDEKVLKEIVSISQLKNVRLSGLHVYDGHVRSSTLEERRTTSNLSFEPVLQLIKDIEKIIGYAPEVITAGSPSFSSAALRGKGCYSPGTTILWDWGYSQLVSELDAQCAAVLLTRVISKPAEGLITIDLGHKAVGSENPLEKRVHFLNLQNVEPLSHSEEHLVLKVDDWNTIKVGDVLYGIPFHVCPTVALYDEAQVIRDHQATEVWNVVGRKRKISV